MPLKTTVKLNKNLCERARRAAEAAGYSSVEELIEHALERELLHHEPAPHGDDLARKLKGLGYVK